MGPKAAWRLTWPQMLMMYLLFFSGIISIWVAGQIGTEVQAAIGITLQCSFFLMVVIMAISSGATAAITQSIGMGKMLRARLYITTTVVGSLILGALMAIPALLFSDQILSLLHLPEEIRPIGKQIWQITAISLPLQYVFSATGVLFRATRQVFPPLWVALLILILNFFGCLGFGLGRFGMPDYGVQGMIWANVGANGIGAIVNCILLAKSGYLRFKPLPSLKWLRLGLPYLLRVALPAGAAQIVWQSGYLTLFILVASVPQDSVNALAGLTAGLRAEALLFMPGMAFNMTCSIMVGNSLGLGEANQARKLGLTLTAIASIAMSIVAAFVWPFRTDIAAFLSTDPATQVQIVSYLSYNLAGTPLSIASQVMGGIMIGAGATQYNLLVYGGTFWAVRIPVGWLLGHKLWGTASGVFAAMVISSFIQTCIMLYVVIHCNWARFAMKKQFTSH